MKIYTCILLFTLIVFLHSVESFFVWDFAGNRYTVNSQSKLEEECLDPATKEFLNEDGFRFSIAPNGKLTPMQLPVQAPAPEPINTDVIRRRDRTGGILSGIILHLFTRGSKTYQATQGDTVVRGGVAHSQFDGRVWKIAPPGTEIPQQQSPALFAHQEGQASHGGWRID